MKIKKRADKMMNKSCHTCIFGGTENCEVCEKCFEIVDKTGKAREMYIREETK
jgi:hypothetical protein